MTGPDTPPEPVDPADDDWPDVRDVQPEPKGVTLVCPECGEYIVIKDIHAYVSANHYAVCGEMTLLNGSQG